MVKTSRDDVWKASPAAGTVGPVLRDTSSPGAALTSGHRLSLNITRSFSPSSGGQEAVTRVLRGAVPNPKPPGEGPSCLFHSCLFQVLGPQESLARGCGTPVSASVFARPSVCTPSSYKSPVIGFRAHPNLG